MAWSPVGGFGTDDTDELTALNEIQTAVAALASAKGLLQDLRVTPTGAVTVAQGTAGNLQCTITVAANQDFRNITGAVANQTNTGGLPLNNAVPNWQNSVAQDAFVRNIVRS